MKPLTFLPFLATTLATPTTLAPRQDPPPDDTTSNCPETWLFDLSTYHGPGCPDSSPDFNSTSRLRTSQSLGSHSVPGCENAWAWFQMPYMSAHIGPDVPAEKASSWCEMKLSYREYKGTFAPWPVPLEEAAWKLGMHRNGTTMEAGYALGEGVRAVWRFRYYGVGKGDTKVVDEIAVEGPVNEGDEATGRLDWSSDKSRDVKWTEPRCGIASMNLRVELELISEYAEAEGSVIASDVENEYGTFSGPMLGISHEFVPCNR